MTIPSFDGNTGNHLSDMYYCEYDGGGDFIQKCILVGFQLPIPEVEAQVNKT